MLIFAQFYEQREACAARGVRAAILQMGTGEGKSIVIAMMAIYTVKHLGTNPNPNPNQAQTQAQTQTQLQTQTQAQAQAQP